MDFVQPIRELEKIEEIKKELKRSSKRNYILFYTGINTGLRISDLLQLKVKDVQDTTHIVITEKKTGKNNRFKINKALRKEIDDYIKNMGSEEYLFNSGKERQRPISRVQAYRILRAAAVKTGVAEVGTHSLRKTFGYHFYQMTKDLALLQKILNHSSTNITLRYIGIQQDALDEAIDRFSL
jgi:integrase